MLTVGALVLWTGIVPKWHHEALSWLTWREWAGEPRGDGRRHAAGAASPTGGIASLVRMEAMRTFMSTWTMDVKALAAGLPVLDQQRFNVAELRQRLDTLGRPPLLFLPPLGGVQLELKVTNKWGLDL